MCIVDGRKAQCLNIIIAIQGTFMLWYNVIKLIKMLKNYMCWVCWQIQSAFHENSTLSLELARNGA